MTGARFFAKQREAARLAAIRASTQDAVNAAVGKRWTDEGADAPSFTPMNRGDPCPICLAPQGEGCGTVGGVPAPDCMACRGTGRVV